MGWYRQIPNVEELQVISVRLWPERDGAELPSPEIQAAHSTFLPKRTKLIYFQ